MKNIKINPCQKVVFPNSVKISYLPDNSVVAESLCEAPKLDLRFEYHLKTSKGVEVEQFDYFYDAEKALEKRTEGNKNINATIFKVVEAYSSELGTFYYEEQSFGIGCYEKANKKHTFKPELKNEKGFLKINSVSHLNEVKNECGTLILHDWLFVEERKDGTLVIHNPEEFPDELYSYEVHIKLKNNTIKNIMYFEEYGCAKDYYSDNTNPELTESATLYKSKIYIETAILVEHETFKELTCFDSCSDEFYVHIEKLDGNIVNEWDIINNDQD